MSEIQIRVVGVFLDGQALAADSAETLDCPQALNVGVRVTVVVGVGHGESGGGGFERGGGRIGSGRFVVVFWFRVENVGQKES